MPFANLYWSADYYLGIKSLTLQLQQSLRQLHELRDFVARYTTHVRSNSIAMERFADTIGTIGTPYNTPTGSAGTRKVSGRVFSGNRAVLRSFSESIPEGKREHDQIQKGHQQSKSQAEHKESKQASYDLASSCPSPVTLATATETYKVDLLSESRCLSTLAAALDRQVLEEINNFVRLYEPVVRAAIETFERLYDEQAQLSIEVEKLKIDYNDARRRLELGKEAPKPPKKDLQDSSDDDEETESTSSPSLIVDGKYLGKLSEQKLASLLKEMIETVPSLKRKFPLPGQSNTVISSELICSWITKKRPCALNPTMRELEHFGQELLDSKLLVGTFLGPKKFRSVGMWFEWSDLARFVAGDGPSKQATAVESKRWLETTQRFNSLVVNMSSMLGGNVDQVEAQLEERYDNAYLQLQKTRHALIEEISSKTLTLERFEKLRIELTYQSLTRMLEVVYNSSLTSSKRLHEFATHFITSINQPQNYQADFDQLELNNGTGIFFPTSFAGLDPHKTTYNYFQNVKHQFNLYKDIPLQAPVPKGDLLSFASLPHFLYRTTTIIEEKDDGNAKDAWKAPLDHSSYWQLKEKMISLIGQYDNPENILDVNASDRSIMEPLLLVLELSPLDKVVNFLKNWLLEIGDSVIPFMVYDGLISRGNQDRDEIVKLLLTIPRSNLSSLIHILEHVSCVFGLNLIPSYGISDNVERDLIGEDNQDDINEVASSLTDMSAIGAVPFLHVLLRPSLSKVSTGFKPPLDVYGKLLANLLTIDLRMKLFESLVENERNYQSKKENARLGLKKNRNLTPPREELKVPEIRSPNPLPADSFTLRPFRTGTTPIPSPVSSPGREIVVKKTRDNSA